MHKRTIQMFLAMTLIASMISTSVQAAGPKITFLGDAADYTDLLKDQYSNGQRKVVINGKVGSIDQTGKLIIPNLYTKLTSLGGGLHLAIIDNKEGVINDKGETIIPIKYDEIVGPSIDDGIFRVILDNKTGYIRKDGTIVTDTIFSGGYDFNGGGAIVFDKTKKKGDGAIDTNGKLIHDFIYDGMGQTTRYEFWNGIILARDSKNYTGVLNTKGEIAAPFIYNNGWALDIMETDGFLQAAYNVFPEAERIAITQDTAPLYSDGRRQPGRMGLIDFHGKEIVPAKYTRIGFLQKEKAFRVSLPPEMHKHDPAVAPSFIVDVNGNRLTPVSGYTYYSEMFNGIRVTSKGKLIGGLNAQNQEVVPFIYDAIHPFNTSGTAWAQKNGLWGLIDKTGKTVVDFQFDKVQPDAPEPYSLVSNARADLSRLKDRVLRQPGDLVYQENGIFTADGQSHSKQIGANMMVRGTPLTGIARVIKGTKAGYIDPTGRVIAPCIYNNAMAFDCGRAIVQKDGKYIVLDETGRELNPDSKITYIRTVKWSSRVIYPETPIVVDVGQYQNYMTSDGRLLLKESSRTAKGFSGGIARVQTGLGVDEFGYIDKKGQWVIPTGTVTDAQVFKDSFCFIVVGDKLGLVWEDDLDTLLPTAAAPSSTKITVNDQPVNVDAYSIDGNNYIKIRDMAYIINGTDKNFNVQWDGAKNAINLISKTPYEATPTDMQQGDGVNKSAQLATSDIYVDGVETPMTAYRIGDNNYFKLRDVMQVFDVAVGWDNTTGTASLDTKGSYEAPSLTNGVYRIRVAANPEFELCVFSNIDKSGSGVALSNVADKKNHNFILTDRGDGFYTMEAGHSNMRIGNTIGDVGRQLQQNNSTGGKFKFILQANGSYRIQCGNDYYVGVENGSIKREAKVITQKEKNDKSQLFIIEKQ